VQKFDNLIYKFTEIYKKGWIESVNDNYNGVLHHGEKSFRSLIVCAGHMDILVMNLKRKRN